MSHPFGSSNGQNQPTAPYNAYRETSSPFTHSPLPNIHIQGPPMSYPHLIPFPVTQIGAPGPQQSSVSSPFTTAPLRAQPFPSAPEQPRVRARTFSRHYTIKQKLERVFSAITDAHWTFSEFLYHAFQVTEKTE